MTHNDIRSLLEGEAGSFLAFAVSILRYSWCNPNTSVRFKQYSEVAIRYTNGRTTRFGNVAHDRYSIDSVLTVLPGRAALAQSTCFSIGVEIKDQLQDLRHDDKIHKYLGWTNYLVLVVPHELVKEACAKAESIEYGGTTPVGVYDVEQMLLVKKPGSIKVKEAKEIQLLRQLAYSQRYKINANPISEEQDEKEVENFEAAAEETPTMTTEETDVKEKPRGLGMSQEERERRAKDVADQARFIAEPVRSNVLAKSDVTQEVFHTVRKEPGLSAVAIADKMGVSLRTVTAALTTLKKDNLVEHTGTKKTGGYKTTKEVREYKYAPACTKCSVLLQYLKTHKTSQKDQEAIKAIQDHRQLEMDMDREDVQENAENPDRKENGQINL